MAHRTKAHTADVKQASGRIEASMGNQVAIVVFPLPSKDRLRCFQTEKEPNLNPYLASMCSLHYLIFQ